MKKISFLSILTLFVAFSYAQQGAYFDAAQAYNRLLIEKNNGTYTQVSNYRVIGSPYLFGDKRMGNIFSPNEKAFNINLRYNFYNQQVEFWSTANPNNALMKEPGTLDSFTLLKNESIGVEQDLVFVYAPLLGFKDKVYMQVMHRGVKYTLYKKYYAELGVVADNILQSELKQFNLNVDYYYTGADNKNPQKLKVTVPGLKKEFPSAKEATEGVDKDLLITHRDSELTKFIVALNK